MTLIHGFQLLEEKNITELNLKALLYKHVKTGAQLLSLITDDENKAFNIAFRTPSMNSTGVAHIMEHSVLCGSRKYRCKEPFIELVKGSMKTFVNAMTGSEATYYPVASTNSKDFYNLVNVYLDCVLYPLITKNAFHQEGWRYDLENPEDEMLYKGVVFNEMKGYYSSPDLHLYDNMNKALCPDTIYGHDSGGNPQHIPDLTYEAFVNFHKKFYHPSNSRTVFYGDDDPEERLRLMDAWFSDFEKQEIDSQIARQTPLQQPKSYVFPYPAGKDNAEKPKCHMLLGWLIDKELDIESALAQEILGYILISSPASPLRKALEDSGLGSQVTGGFDAGTQSRFYAGLKDVEKENCEKVEALILDTLESIAKKGIDREMIEAALNTIEFSVRENNTGSFPKGLALGFEALRFWLFEKNPIDALAFEKPLEAIKAKAAPGSGFFEKLIEDDLLRNNSRATVIVEPDTEMSEKLDKAEKERIAKERAAMSPEDIETILNETRELKKFQETPDAPELLAAIPTLTLADLDKKIKTAPSAISEIAGAEIHHYDLSTSGIIYLDLAFDFRSLPSRLLSYLPLFSVALTQLGAGDYDYVRMIQRIHQKTGGIEAYPFVSSISDSQDAAARLFVSAKALPSQADDLMAILEDALLNAHLENRDRLKQMVTERKARYESRIANDGRAIVAAKLDAKFGLAGAAASKLSGVDYYFFLRDLLAKIDSDWESVLADLKEIREIVINREGMKVGVTLDGENWNSLKPALTSLLEKLPANKLKPADWSGLSASQNNEAFTVPGQVSAVGKAFDLRSLGFNPGGEAIVASKWLRTTWLWEQVRMKGGAYGANSSFAPRTGVFAYSSAQDPNILGTLSAFDKTAEFLATTPLSDSEITRGIIGAISDLDAYQLPDAKGHSALLQYLTGDTDEIRQKRRDEVLSTTEESLRKLAEALRAGNASGKIVVVGPQTAITEAAKNVDFDITPVL